MAQGKCTAVMLGTSSAGRKLKGLHPGIVSFAETLRDQTVVVYGDNQLAVQALEIGSKPTDLQRVCVNIFRKCTDFAI